MNQKVTIYDLSKSLGIAPSTVHRALYGNGRVSEETQKKVIDAAGRMGFKPNKAAKSLSRKTIKIGLIMNGVFPDFHNEVLRGAKTACEELSDFNVTLDFYMPSLPFPLRGQEILSKMIAMADEGCSGIIVQHPADTSGFHSGIAQLHDRSVPVVTVVSDIRGSKRIFNVRTDGYVAGRMAAELLWGFAKVGRCAVFTGFKGVEIHDEKVTGFCAEMERHAIEIAEVIEAKEDPQTAYEMADHLFSTCPDLSGIYINSSNSASIIQCAYHRGLQKKLVIITSDIFPELKTFIEDGAVSASIFQDPFRQGYQAFEGLYRYIADRAEIESEILLQPQIIIKSNLHYFTGR